VQVVFVLYINSWFTASASFIIVTLCWVQLVLLWTLEPNHIQPLGLDISL